MNEKPESLKPVKRPAPFHSDTTQSSVPFLWGALKGEFRIVIPICIFLAAIVWFVFGQTLGHQFVNYDDDVNVYDYPDVSHGLTSQGLLRAFEVHANIWRPWTTISHMWDCQFFGLNPWGHHLTNVLIHGAAAILLFLALRVMTGAIWRSAFVASVFAIHPLRVESVAWVSGREDPLSGVFFMLILGAYALYTQKPARGRYLAVIALFAIGLMSKPTLVTVPFLLLLLDYWPLRRSPEKAGPRFLFIPRNLLLEKIPLFALSVGECLVTLHAQKHGIAMLQGVSVADKIGNALVSYVVYAGEMIYPGKLAVLYPFPVGGLPMWEVLLAFLVLVLITASVFVLRREYPFLLVGWLWYLGVLAPMAGFVQVGAQSHADRYTYLPQIGLYIAIAWLVARVCAGVPYRRLALGGALAVVAALALSARVQASYWKDSESLWTRAIAVTRNNSTAHYNLGNYLREKGRLNEAAAQYQQTIEIRPNFEPAKANLAGALLQQGHMDQAIALYQQALEIKGDDMDALNGLGIALFQVGQVDEAMVQFQKAIALKPDDEPTLCNLGNGFWRQRRFSDAIANYQKALAIQPDDVRVQNSLAYLLATSRNDQLRNGGKAVELAQRAAQLTGGNNPMVLATLAASYAEAGQFAQAVETAQRASNQAVAQGKSAMANAIRRQLNLYLAGQPLRDN